MSPETPLLSTPEPVLPSHLRYSLHRFAQLSEWQRLPVEAPPLVLYCDHIGPQQQATVYYHDDFCSLYIVRSGRGIHVIDGVPHAVARGDVYAMGPGMAHYFRDGESLVTDTLHFAPVIFDSATYNALVATQGFHAFFGDTPTHGATGLRWMHLTPAAWGTIAAQVTELRREWQRRTPDGYLLSKVLFFRLLVHLARFYAGHTHTVQSPERSPLSREETVAVAVRYLDSHFAEPLRIEHIAALVCLSPDRFTEVFVEVMGRTPRDYLRHLRLESARTLLRDSNYSISEVARRSGFREAAYLTRVFRAATGLPPRAFRQHATRTQASS